MVVMAIVRGHGGKHLCSGAGLVIFSVLSYDSLMDGATNGLALAALEADCDDGGPSKGARGGWGVLWDTEDGAYSGD